jgi:hypothetical protein
MARRVWIPKIDGAEGLDFKNRWRRGFLIFQKQKVNVPDEIWYIDFCYTWLSWFFDDVWVSNLSRPLIFNSQPQNRINVPDGVWYIENLWFWGLDIDLIFGAQT